MSQILVIGFCYNMAAGCTKIKRTFVTLIKLGCLILVLKFLLFPIYVHVFHSEHQTRNFLRTNVEIVQSAGNPENFAFSQKHKSSEISRKLPEAYVTTKDPETTTKGRYTLSDLSERVSPVLEEIPTIRLNGTITQQATDENAFDRSAVYENTHKNLEKMQHSHRGLARTKGRAHPWQMPNRNSGVSKFGTSSTQDTTNKIVDGYVMYKDPPADVAMQVSNTSSRPNDDAYKSHVLARDEQSVLAKGCQVMPTNTNTNITSVVFVKVHKSASTTIANILARYALRYGLQVALPNKPPNIEKFNYFEETITRDAVFPPLLKGGHYNVMFSHMIFNRSNIQALMPSDTFYFAIMRHPEDRFMSSFCYYGLAGFLMKKFGFSGPEEALGFFLRTYKFFRASKPELYNSLASNTGLALEKQKDPRHVHEHARTLERDLHLVLVMEHFDESLVLLKRKACLRMKDILYIKKNVRRKTEKAQVSSNDSLLLRKYQMADFILYDHFYKVFWEKVVAEGAEFFLEVQRFREVQKTLTHFCSTHTDTSNQVFADVDASPWNERFQITRRECFLLQASELDMQRYLMERAARWLVRSSRVP